MNDCTKVFFVARSLPVHQSLFYPSVDSAVLVLVLYYHDPSGVDDDDDDLSETKNDWQQQNLVDGCDLSQDSAAECKVRILTSLDCGQAEVACGHHETMESDYLHWTSGIVVDERRIPPAPLPHRRLLLPRHHLSSPANGITWMMTTMIMQPPCLKT